MNALCYKTVFSKRLGALVAVGEHASSQGKGQGAGAASGAWTLGSVLRYVGVLALGFASVSLAWSQTLPQGGRVSQGQVTISQSGQQMAITQSTAKAVVNWDSFDIGANAKVNIAQPSSQSVLLNRVLSDNPTQILGQLQANGQVVLVNPKGIVVGSDGSVSASAFTASTLNISDADFMAGNGRYSREGSTGEVVNKGRISVAPGGYVALLGARVSNEGTIIAPQGGVALGAAETVTVPIGRTGKIKLELTPASINASVANQKGGVIIAEGGQVYMQAAALGQAVASVLHSGHIDTSGAQAGAVHLLADGGRITVDGSITANSSGQDDQGQLRKGGDIFIGRDEETGVLAKTTDASGAKLESQRGFVETSGDHLVTTGTRVKAGEWLLDPTNITIGTTTSGTTYTDPNATGGSYAYTAGATSFVRASDIQASLNDGTSVTIATSSNGLDAGNISVNSAISKTAGDNAILTLTAHNNIILNAGISSSAGTLGVTLNAGGTGGISGNSSGTINTNGGMLTLNSTHASASGTLEGVISGTGAVTKTGIGTTTFTGQNSYSGGTHIQTGTLVGTNAGADNHTYRGFGSGTIAIANSAIAHANGVNGTGYNNLTNTVTGSGTFQITGSSVNRTLVHGDYSGFTGRIELLAKNTQLTSGVNTTAEVNINAGATLSVWTTHGTPIFGALSGSGNVTAVVNGSANMTIGNGGAHGTFSGVISNSGTISINKVGSGTQVLTGANTYTGTTTISGGTLQIGNAGTSGTLGTGAVTNNAMLTFNRSNNIAVANLISGSGGLTQLGGGTTTLTAANTFTGTTLVSGGTLALGNVNALQNSTLNTGTSGAQQVTFTVGGANTYNIGALEGADDLAIGANSIGVGSNNASTTYSGVLSGTRNFSKVGDGTQILSGDNTYTGTTTINGGTLQVGNGGTTGTLGAGDVTLSDNANLSYVRSAVTTIANNISGTGNVSASITGASSTLTVSNPINLTGSTTSNVVNLAADNNISVAAAIATTNTTSGAVLLNAGKSTNVGTSTGGDISFSGSGTVTVGTGGRATLMTGSVSGSTGLTTLVGAGSSRFRYNSDETDTNYTTALGTGFYGIYREAPVITATVNSFEKKYDGNTYSGGNGIGALSGYVNGDTVDQLGSITYGGTSQTNKNVGTHTLTGTAASALGYAVSLTPGTLTINKANLTVTASSVTKTYDGTTDAGTTTVPVAGLATGDMVVSGAVTQVFSDPNAGSNKTVRASGVTIKDAANADMTGNYSIDYVDNKTSTIFQKEVSLSAAKTYDGNKTLTGTQLNISTGVGTETLGFTSASINSKNVADNSVNFVGAVTLSNGSNGGRASNYKLPALTAKSANNTVTLTAKALTSAIAGVTTTYGTTAAPGAVSLTGIIGTEDVQATNTATLVNVSNSTSTSGQLKAGSYKQTVSSGLTGADASNYRFDGFESPTANFVVNPLALTGTAIGDVTTTYGTLASAGAVSFTNVQGSDKVTATAAVTGGSNSSSGHLKAGKYQQSATTITGDDAGNYSFNGFETPTANFVVNPLALTGTAIGDVTTTYGTPASAGAVSFTNVQGSDKVTATAAVTGGSNSSSGHLKAGNYQQSATTITGDDAGNYSFAGFITSNSNYVVTQKDLVITASAAVKVYDATTTAIASLSSDKFASDNLDLAKTSANFDTKNVADNKTVTVSGLAISGTDAGNYRLTNTTTTTTANITPKAITLSGITANDKVYDGKTDAVVSVASAQFAGKIDGDVLSVTSAGSFADKDAGPSKTVNLVNTLGGADLGNYSITQQTTAQAEISKAPLLVKVGDTAMFVTQDPNSAFHQDIDYVGFQNNETATDVFGTVTRTYVGSANPVTGSYANVYGVASTKPPSNYEVSVQSNLNVVAADKLLIHVGNASATYGDLTPANAGGRANTVVAQYCLAPSSCNDSNLVSLAMTRQGGLWTATDSTNSSIQFNTVVDTTGQTSKGGFVNAGSYRFGAEGLTTQGTVNFNGSFVSGGLLTITPKSVTLNASDVTKVYDGNTNLLSATLVPTDAMAGDALQAAFTSGNFAGKDAGSQSFNLNGLTLQGADQANYVLTNKTLSGTGTITPKAITVSGLRAQDKVYDGTTLASVQTSGAVFNGILAGDQLSVTASGQFDTRHVGTNKTVSLTSIFGGADLGNYTITPQASSTASITPAPLVVTASAARKTYDGNTTAPGVGTVGTLVGAAAGDKVDFGGTQAFADKQAGIGKTLTVSGVRLIDGSQTDVTGNYAITYVSSQNGVIDKANASITAQANSTVYNGSTQSQSGVVLSGFLTGDDVQASGLASGRNAGSYQSSLSASGADAGNYNITYNNASLNISKRPASLSALGQTVVYNGQTQSLNGTQGSGFVAGDALNFGGLPSGRHVGRYTSAMTVSGADAANYDVTLGSATLTITPKTASVTAWPERVTYNSQTQQQSAALLEGFVAGDDIRVSGLASGRNAGVYGSNALATGQDVGNYSITYQQGALTIDKAPLQIVGTSAADKQYDGNIQASVTPGRITGLVGNESLSVLSLSGQFDTAEPGSDKPVTVVYGLGDGQNGGLAANYDWSPVKVTANIRREASSYQAAPEASRPVGQYSRLSYIGFGGLTGVGAATGQLHYPLSNAAAQQCTPRKLEECICERPQEGVITLEICYPQRRDQARHSGPDLTTRH